MKFLRHILTGVHRFLSQGSLKRYADVSKPSAFTEEKIRPFGASGLKPYQRHILDFAFERPAVLCKLPRRSGKTSMSLCYALFEAYNSPQSTINILCPTRQISEEKCKVLRGLVRNSSTELPSLLLPEHSTHSLYFSNGSVIRFVSGLDKEVSGILIVDELSLMENSVVHQLPREFPSLSKGVSKTLCFTSNSENPAVEHFFQEAWFSNNGFTPLVVHWSEVFSRKERDLCNERLGEGVFERMYLPRI